MRSIIEKAVECILSGGLPVSSGIVDLICSDNLEESLRIKIQENIRFYKKPRRLNESETDRCVRELELAGLLDKDSDYEGMVGEAVKELLDVFETQGHSGFSAPWVASLFKQLVGGGILAPLTGEDDEWTCISEFYGDGNGEEVYQNKRRSSVFKTHNRNGEFIEAHDIDGGPIFEDPDGCTYCDSNSFLKIESFPYTPPATRDIVKVDHEGNPLGKSND